MVEAQRARHRARYEASKLGGEGVRPGTALADPNPTTPAQENAPKQPLAQGQCQPSPELEQVLAFAQAHPLPEPRIKLGQLNIDVHQQGLGAGSDEGAGVSLSISAPAREGVPPLSNVLGLGRDDDPDAYKVRVTARLKQLVRAMQGQVQLYTPEAKEAWEELVYNYGEITPPEPVLTQPALPIGWDDPSMVWKGKVIKALGRNKWLFKPFKLSLRPEAALHVKNSTLMKAGWTVWTQDNPYTDQGGYVLFGEYNRYGERMK